MTEFRSDVEKRAWEVVRDLPEFHWADMEAAGIPGTTARTMQTRWLKKGRIRQLRKEGHRKIFVNVDRAVEPEALPAARTQEDGMWRVMRRLKLFVPTDVAAHVNAAGFEVTVEKAQSYCRQLLAAGYLRVRQTAVPGKREAAYQLIKDTGPLGPRPTRVRGMADPNDGSFTPASVALR